jgi:hypothetical protein
MKDTSRQNRTPQSGLRREQGQVRYVSEGSKSLRSAQAHRRTDELLEKGEINE